MYVTAILISLALIAYGIPVPAPNQSTHISSNENKIELKLAILEAGFRPNSIVTQYGSVMDDLHRMLSPAFNITTSHSFRCYNNRDIPTLQELNNFDLIVIPGSHLSANSALPWIQRVMKEVVSGEGRKPWLLGICFGHHLVARAFGGVITRNPGAKWWESGAKNFTINTDLVPSSLRNMTHLTCHTEHVSKFPNNGGLKVWASNEHFDNQGMISVEKRIITTQFHPDLSKEYFCGTSMIRGANQSVVDEVMRTKLDTDEMAWIIRRLITNHQSNCR